MSVTWSGDGPDLLLSLDRSDGRPLGHQLQDQLRAAVRDGRLRASERLPSTRRLAEDLGVSRGMVVACYEQLVAEGYLVGSAGSGTRVADGVAEPARASRHAGSAVPVEASRRPVDVDFEYGVPDLRSAPLPDWLWALREAGRNAPTAMMADETDAGSPRLREVVAAYHRRVRAGASDVEHAVVVNGFRQGLVLTLAALARAGVERVGLEDPGPREHDELVRRAGMVPVAVPVDGDGSTSTRCAGPVLARSSSRRRTSARPASCSLRSGGTRSSRGRRRSTGSCWRTTTTRSFATTGNRSGRCRGSRPTGWSRSAR